MKTPCTYFHTDSAPIFFPVRAKGGKVRKSFEKFHAAKPGLRAVFKRVSMK